MKPGVTSRPDASTVRAAGAEIPGATADITPPDTATSAGKAGAPLPVDDGSVFDEQVEHGFHAFTEDAGPGAPFTMQMPAQTSSSAARFRTCQISQPRKSPEQRVPKTGMRELKMLTRATGWYLSSSVQMVKATAESAAR